MDNNKRTKPKFNFRDIVKATEHDVHTGKALKFYVDNIAGMTCDDDGQKN